MKEFLDRNKDLLEQLGPHMEKFNAIQVKVEQHDQQLTVLTETVDQLVKKTEGRCVERALLLSIHC